MNDRIERRSEAITGETLHLAWRSGFEVPKDLISRCRLVDCQLRIDRPRAATLLCSTFVNTRIVFTQTCTTKCGSGCFFDSCTFRGKYFGCLFGRESAECDLKPGLRNCDFTEAILHRCRFLNCTPEDLKLPGWPHVTVFYPRINAEDFADLNTEPALADIQGSMGNSSSMIVAMTYYLPNHINECGMALAKFARHTDRLLEGKAELEVVEADASMENLREMLKRKPYVFM